MREGGKNFRVEKEWVSKDGLRCAIIVSFMGTRCGYVAVEEGHQLYGLGYSDPNVLKHDLRVHGGLTYASNREDYPVKTDKKAWWFGFDCGHSGDAPDMSNVSPLPSILMSAKMLEKMGGKVRTFDYVFAECERLAEQIAAVPKSANTRVMDT